METLPITPEQQSALSLFFGEWFYAIVFAFVVLMFRDSIQNVVAGVMVFIGNDLNHDDVVVLDGRPARIARCGLLKTSFYLYTIDNDGQFVNGTRTQIANIKLSEHSIEKPLPLLSDVLVKKFSAKD
jgi:hypothetical protein